MKAGKIWFMALVAALGGFLFGFDTIVINGAEQGIQRLWNLAGAAEQYGRLPVGVPSLKSVGINLP